jgi:hypothetical protein
MDWRSTSPVFGLLGLVLLIFTNRDPLRLIAAGIFVSPYLLPYHCIVVLPAMGRVRGWQQFVLWLSSVTLLLAVGIETMEIKIIALSFPLLVWLFLAPSLNPRHIFHDPDTLLNRGLTTLKQLRQRFAPS